MNVSDDRLERIEIKVDKIVDQVSKINITLSAQHVSLVEHMRRTTLLERLVGPIKTHVDRVQGAIKMIVLAASIAAIIEALKVVIK